MTQVQTLAAPRPVERSTSSPATDQIQDAKGFEKMQAHGSSHQTAGTHETPAAKPRTGILWELETEGGQH